MLHLLPHQCLSAATVLLVVLSSSDRCSAETRTPDRVSFSRDIRPLLSDRCFRCHGPDRVTRKADLRFDREDSVFADRQGCHVVVPGDPENSELIRRIVSDEESDRMPPVDSGISLTAYEIDLIRRWVEQGAEWEQHWAWIAPRRPDPPAVADDGWIRNPIDRFVLARLETAGLMPSAEADKRTLIRRVSLDLTGLPPTCAEINTFLSDDRPDAYERIVDRLLKSPRYGEKMTLPWLEAARYADTSGYTEDYGRYMYPWRTWVINAFNNNKPFDQFVVEQMAGDLLPHATHDQVLATGFNRNHRINQEVGALPEEFAVEYAIDRLETMGTVFLGTTIGCARCHDHKYDPFSQQEFYQLYAFLNNNDDVGIDHGSRFGFARPFIENPTPEQVAEQARLQSTFDALNAQEVPSDAEQTAFRKWLGEFDAQQSLGLSSWYSLGPFDHDEPTRTTGFANPYFAEPGVDLNETADGQKWIKRPGWVATTLMVPGGEFSTIYLFREIYAPAANGVVLNIGASDSVRIWVNGVVLLDRLDAGDNAATPAPFVVPLKAGRNEFLVKMSNGDFAQQITFKPAERVVFPKTVFHALQKPEAGRSQENNRQLYDHFHATRLAAVQQEIQAVINSIAKVMVMKERDNVRPAHVLGRGRYDHPQEQVEREVPAAFPPLPQNAPRNRLGLARWLISPNHPLTARVNVNRFWQSNFGAGLVRTAEDFGAQGEYPTHPDLLDWLATEFIRSGWDVKHIQKLIVTSATYRQSSATSLEIRRGDPDNRLLSRGPRFRMRPQEIRDQALFVSGLLVERIGGPSVKPYQPEGLWKEVANLKLDKAWFLTDIFSQDHGENLYRRSLYTFWKRSVPPPNMTVFDAETREVCVVVRQNSNTPLQAMNLLNDVSYVEAARHLAHRILTNGGSSTAERLAYGMELVTGRLPSEHERTALRRGFDRQLDEYQKTPSDASALLSQGESEIPGQHDPVVHAAWTQIALLLLNLDETITKQ